MNDRLPDDLRRRFTTAFGLDVSALQFHAASPAAEALGVAAFARGREIHFAPGRFNPGGAPELIAHEISHVVQQAEGRVSPTDETPDGERVNADPALEAEADAAAAKAVRGEPVRPGGAMLTPRTVDIAQAYFRSDAKGHRALSGSGPKCREVYQNLMKTKGKAAADRFQAMADDTTDHGLLSKAYDVGAARTAVAERVGHGTLRNDPPSDPAKRQRVGNASDRDRTPGALLPEHTEPKRKQRLPPAAQTTARGDRGGHGQLGDRRDTVEPPLQRPPLRKTITLPVKPRAASSTKTPPGPTKTPPGPAKTPLAPTTSTGAPAASHDDDTAELTSRGSPLGAWPETQTALRALGPQAPERGDATASWRHYWTALHRDLSLFKGVSENSYEAMLRGVTAVMLYKVHIASSRSLDPPIKGGDIRQESPQDLEDPNVYYRSQDKGHPVITLYKKLITMACDGVERGRILAPYNSSVRALIESATPDDTVAKKRINTEELDGVLHRQKPPSKKDSEDEDSDDSVVSGKKHTEMSAGYIGLRQNNADVIEGALATLFDSEATFKAFTRHVAAEVANAGAVPAKPPALTLVDDHLAGVTSAIADLMTSLTMLSVGPAPKPAPDKPATPPTTALATPKPGTKPTTSTGSTRAPSSAPKPGSKPDPATASPGAGQGLLEQAYLDPSYVVRKLAQASQRADWILRSVGKRRRMNLERTGLNPQITVELVKHDTGLKDGEHITFVNAVRVYFGALLARCAAASGAPLAIAQRQSFGFLESSVTDTHESFRISIGTEPVEMLEAIRDALIALDDELATAAKAGPAACRAFAGRTTGRAQPLKTFAKSSDAKYLGYWGAIAGNQNLGAFLAGAPEITRQLKASPGPQRAALMQRQAGRAALALGKIERTAKKTTKVTGPMHDELAIVEPLQNTLLMAGDALGECIGWDPTVLPHTRIAALADLAAAVQRAQRAVDGYAKGLGDGQDTALRVATHRTLRNATEDIVDALTVFLATTETFTSSPEDDMTELLRALHELPVDVFRTDGGEQAGAVSIAALRNEQTGAGKKFGLDITGPKAYFEFNDFLKQNGIEHGLGHKNATATLIDPRPYVTKVASAFDGVQEMQKRVAVIAHQLRSKPAPTTAKKPGRGSSTAPALPPAMSPQHTVLLDVTNIDLLSREVTQLIASVRDLIDRKLLRVILINSGVKHEQQGTDRYQVGRIVVIGESLAGVQDTTENSLITQFLHMTQRLRMHDAAPVTVHDRGYEARNLLATAKRYTRLIERYGARDAWASALEACKVGLQQTTGPSSKLLEVGTPKAEIDASVADQAAMRGLQLIDQALLQLIAELQKAKPEPIAYEVFSGLPPADQDFVRGVLAPDTSSSGSGGKTGGDKTTGASKKQKVHAPELTPPGQATATGVRNAGNTCYLSAGLSVLAATEPYYAMFAPVIGEGAPRSTLRATVRAILDAIRGGHAVATDAIDRLLDQLEAAGLLPQPSAHDRQFGITARTAQHDLSEAIFRKLIDHLGAPDALATQHVHQSDFRNQQLRPSGGNAAQLSQLPENRVLREVQREVLIELPITQGDTLAAIVAALRQPENVDGLRVAIGRIAQIGRGQRSEEFEGAPQALAFALKRFDLLEKDERPIDMPSALQWNGYHYSLQAVGYHVGETIGGGHYTASTRGTDGAWRYRDDGEVTPQSNEHFAAHKNYGTLFTYARGAAIAQPQPQPPQQVAPIVPATPVPTPTLLGQTRSTLTTPAPPTPLDGDRMEIET